MDQALGGFASMLLEKMRVVEAAPEIRQVDLPVDFYETSVMPDEPVPTQEKTPSEILAAQKNSVINRMYPVVIDTCNAEEV